MENSKAIVTLAIGSRYLQRWKSLCEANWQKYAQKHGYDLIVIDKPIDDTERALLRSPAWQKCLILSQDFARNYERVVWVDSDILINSSNAPCIATGIPLEKVGAVDQWSSPTPELHTKSSERMFQAWEGQTILSEPPTAREYYAKWGLPPEFDQVVQTGVMVFSPEHHRSILEKVYFEYEEKGISSLNYEMRPLSYELIKAGLVYWIDERFNSCWLTHKALYYPFLFAQNQTERSLFARLKRKVELVRKFSSGYYKIARLCATTSFLNSYFFHFAGAAGEMTLVDLDVTSWKDLIDLGSK